MTNNKLEPKVELETRVETKCEINQPFCVFCKRKNGRLIMFSNERLEKCIGVLKIRKIGRLTGANVVLPEELDDCQGYHSLCYRGFTALPIKWRGYALERSLEFESSKERDVAFSLLETVIKEDWDATSDFDDIGKEKNFGENNNESINHGRNDSVVGHKNAIQGDNIIGTVRVINFSKLSSFPVCLFCNKNRKQRKYTEQNLSLLMNERVFERMWEGAEDIGDSAFLKKLQDIKSQNSSIFYHKWCYRSYFNLVKSKKNKIKAKTEWHITQNYHSKAYQEVCKYVFKNVIVKGLCFSLANLNIIFRNYLMKHKIYIPADQTNFGMNMKHLEKRLLYTFPGKVAIISENNKKIVAASIPFKAHSIIKAVG